MSTNVKQWKFLTIISCGYKNDPMPTPESDVEEEQISFLLMGRCAGSTFSRKKGGMFSTMFESDVEFKGNIRNVAGEHLLYAYRCGIEHYFLVLGNCRGKIECIRS